jgi:Flp pilus assembly pilin Flp
MNDRLLAGVRTFLAADEASPSAEYAFLVAGIAIAVLAAITGLGAAVLTLYERWSLP